MDWNPEVYDHEHKHGSGGDHGHDGVSSAALLSEAGFTDMHTEPRQAWMNGL